MLYIDAMTEVQLFMNNENAKNICYLHEKYVSINGMFIY